MIAIYSKEQIDRYSPYYSIFTNGTLIKSLSFIRNNYNNTIYVNFTLVKTSFPASQTRAKCYRGYLENNVLSYDVTTSNFLNESGEILFPYVSQYERNYVNYYVVFECIGNLDSLTINEVGLIFQKDNSNKGIISTNNRIISVISSNNKDINQIFLSHQEYNKTIQFTFLTNRNNIDRIVNIIESPFKLIDVKNNCINNSTRELSIITRPVIKYNETNTQYVSITLNCIEEI